MNMNPLPPQAYTKETLVKAYAWLQTQSEHIKELATTPDVLVSLFLKAKLQGESALERPSIQNFKAELKNLAGMIGDFEVIEPMPSMPPPPGFSKTAPTVRFRSQDLKTETNTPPAAAAPATPQPPAAHQGQERPSSWLAERDSRSESMIQEVKNQFNLSHEDEAIRLLIATGYHQLKSLMKR